MDSKNGGQSSNNLQRQAAAALARQKVLAAYAESAKNAAKTSGVGLLPRRCSGKGLHLAMTGEPRGFSRVTAGFSSYDGEFRMPLVLAQAYTEHLPYQTM